MKAFWTNTRRLAIPVALVLLLSGCQDKYRGFQWDQAMESAIVRFGPFGVLG